MVCLNVARCDTRAGRYTVALFITGVDYEVDVVADDLPYRDPRRRHTVWFDAEQRAAAREYFAAAVWALTPAV